MKKHISTKANQPTNPPSSGSTEAIDRVPGFIQKQMGWKKEWFCKSEFQYK